MFQEFKTLADLMVTFQDNEVAIEHFKAIRWRNGAFCPHCEHNKVYGLGRKGIYRCAKCRKNFSITVGTIFENTKLPLRIWFGAIWLITNHKKGIASTTLATDLGITQKSAWFILHRLRHAARTKSFNKPLHGTVEVDDTYVGGKAINRHGRRSGIGGGYGPKTPVVGAVERSGLTVARVVVDGSKSELQGFIREVVSPKAEMLVTDSHAAYGKLTGYERHEIINHNRGEYRRGKAHTNSIESVWALLKRQIIGIPHWVSPKHLDRYVGEMTWRLNRRTMDAQDRMNDLLASVESRLTYRALIA